MAAVSGVVGAAGGREEAGTDRSAQRSTHAAVRRFKLRHGLPHDALDEHAPNEAVALPLRRHRFERIEHRAVLIRLDAELSELLRELLALPLQHAELFAGSAIGLRGERGRGRMGGGRASVSALLRARGCPEQCRYAVDDVPLARSCAGRGAHDAGRATRGARRGARRNDLRFSAARGGSSPHIYRTPSTRECESHGALNKHTVVSCPPPLACPIERGARGDSVRRGENIHTCVRRRR